MLRAAGLFLVGLCFSLGVSAEEKSDWQKCVDALNEGQYYLGQFLPEKAYLKYDTASYYARNLHDNFLIGASVIGTGQSFWYTCQFSKAIDSINKGIYYLRRARKESESWHLPAALRIASNLYDQLGDYVKAFETITESLELSRKSKNKDNTILALVQLGHIYLAIGDYTTARLYYKQSQDLKPEPRSYQYRELHRQLGEFYAEKKDFDSAMYHYNLSIPGHPSPRNVYMRIGELYLLRGEPAIAYDYLRDVYPGALAKGDVPILTPTMIGLGKAYLSLGKIDSAFLMAKHALELATEKGTREIVSNASLLLSEVYASKKDSAKAFVYYRQYVRVKDSVISEQLRGQLYSFQRKADREHQEDQLRLLKWGIITLAVIALFVIFILLLRHKNEKLKLEQRSADLKMQALRTQMNPHFIFNCLSAINHFILNNEMDKASGYLTRFARLIRLVLVNSEKNIVTLEEELDTLKLYLSMEQLRFKDAFAYEIRYDMAIQPAMVEIPSFLLQPFCENAIWHGLLHKEGKGELVIDLSMQEDAMICTITDNGIGRDRAAKMKQRSADKQGSFGLALTTERLAIFNNDSKQSGSFKIEDVTDQTGTVTGTRVILSIKNKKA